MLFFSLSLLSLRSEKSSLTNSQCLLLTPFLLIASRCLLPLLIGISESCFSPHTHQCRVHHSGRKEKRKMSNSPKDITGKAPLYVFLQSGEKEKLPSPEYIRVVAQHMGRDQKVVRHDFALHHRGARLCRLLEPLLDAVDVDLRPKLDPCNGAIPPVTLPQATKEGCESVFLYLDLVQTRVPTLLSKPLRAPLEELVQPWELTFLLENCFGRSGETGFKSTTAFFKEVVKAGSSSMDRLLEVAMLSDFLLVESLRDLTCAFLASLALSASTGKELLQLSGLEKPLTETDLEPLYNQLDFLRPRDEV